MAAKPVSALKRESKPAVNWRGWSSIALAALVTALYWIRPLQTEAVTVWPSWIWAIPALAITLDAPKKLWRSLRWPLLVWLVPSLMFSEIWRMALPKNPGQYDVRVVTLNTGARRVSGNFETAMREVAACSPDIVLLQETPQGHVGQQSVQEYFGRGYVGVFGMDASIIVKGKVVSSYSRQSNFTIAHVRLESGGELDVVSLRLRAPHARLDYWNKECWQTYSRHRVKHLEELRELWRRVNDHRTGKTMVLGGDFNLVPDKEDMEILGPELTDSYRVAGRGWYATALDGANLFRIDKVWTTEALTAKGTYSVASAPSDHRYVVAQFDWTR